MHSKVVSHYTEMFPNLGSLLDKFILPDALKKLVKEQELAKQNKETF